MARPTTVVATWKPKLEAWLNEVESAYRAQPETSRRPTMPLNHEGMVNVQEIAKRLSCARAYLYDYEELSGLIDLVAEGQGLPPLGARSQSVGDKLMKQRIAAIARAAKVDAQAAVEAKAALVDALRRGAELQGQLSRLGLENAALKERLALINQGLVVRVR